MDDSNIENKYFAIKSTNWREFDWVYVDAFNVLLMILGITKSKKQIVLIRQFRPPLNNYVLSLPMGAFNPNPVNDFYAIAASELTNETGYIVNKIKHEITFARSPGLTNELAMIFTAELDDMPQQQNLHKDEEIEVVLASFENYEELILSYIANGDFLDSSLLFLLNSKLLNALTF